MWNHSVRTSKENEEQVTRAQFRWNIQVSYQRYFTLVLNTGSCQVKSNIENHIKIGDQTFFKILIDCQGISEISLLLIDFGCDLIYGSGINYTESPMKRGLLERKIDYERSQYGQVQIRCLKEHRTCCCCHLGGNLRLLSRIKASGRGSCRWIGAQR